MAFEDGITVAFKARDEYKDFGISVSVVILIPVFSFSIPAFLLSSIYIIFLSIKASGVLLDPGLSRPLRELARGFNGIQIRWHELRQ